MEIHVSRDGKQFGPYTLEEVNGYLESGFLKADDLAWCEGMESWSPLHTIQGVTASPGKRRPPPPPPSPPSQPSASPAPGVKPDTYLVSAILATLFCCLPFGVVAIVYAAQVDSKWNAGDQAGARDASGKAKLWSNVAAITGAVVMGLWVLGVIVSSR